MSISSDKYLNMMTKVRKECNNLISHSLSLACIDLLIWLCYVTLFSGIIQFSFPFKLHSILEEFAKQGLEDVCSWQPNGKGFKIHKSKEFAQHVMPKYFRNTKYNSFRRQLQMYEFKWVKDRTSPDYACYIHPLFQRGKRELCVEMNRTKIKGSRKSNTLKSGKKTNNSSTASSVVTQSQVDDQGAIRRVSLNEETLNASLCEFARPSIETQKMEKKQYVSKDSHSPVKPSNMGLQNILSSICPMPPISFGACPDVTTSVDTRRCNTVTVKDDFLDIDDASLFAGRRFFPVGL